MTTLLSAKTPTEYFKEIVEEVMARQRVSTSELSAFYLVQLLDGFVAGAKRYQRAEASQDDTLAELLLGAFGGEGRDRFVRFKLTGDVSLFLSGFFSDSLARRRVDLDYYRRMGGYAYGRAAVLAPESSASMFLELQAKFGRFVDVLNEVSLECGVGEEASMLKLYDRWLQTRSARSERRLRELGVLLRSSAARVH